MSKRVCAIRPDDNAVNLLAFFGPLTSGEGTVSGQGVDVEGTVSAMLIPHSERRERPHSDGGVPDLTGWADANSPGNWPEGSI